MNVTLGIDVPWRVVWRDIASWFFGVAALLTLIVSLPATYAVLEPFHNSGQAGTLLALFAVMVFEIGAVGAKLITLAVPQWSKRLNVLTLVLLVLTTLANFAHGLDLFSRADLAPSLDAVRRSGGATWAAIGAAALFPALLYTWLASLVARCKMLATHCAKTASQDDAHLTQLAQVRDAAATAIAQVRQIEQERDALMTQVQESTGAEASLHGAMRQAEEELRQADVDRAMLQKQLRQLEQERDAVRVLSDATDVQIGGHSYTTRQAAGALGITESMLRRKLKAIEGEV